MAESRERFCKVGDVKDQAPRPLEFVPTKSDRRQEAKMKTQHQDASAEKKPR